MKKLLLISNNSLDNFDTIKGLSLEELNHEKNKLELQKGYLYDICLYLNGVEMPDKITKPRPKTIMVFDKKTIKIRNDFEQWSDVKGVEQSGGSDKITSTVVLQSNIQKSDEIIKDLFNFIPMTIFTPDMWYCGSVEFNAISQYYKGNHDTFAQEQWNAWYQREGKELITKEEFDYLPFVNFIKRLGFNYE